MRQKMGLRAAPKLFNPPPMTPWRPSVFRFYRWPIIIVALMIVFFFASRLPIFRVTTIEVVGADDPSILATIEEQRGSSLFAASVRRLDEQLLDRHFLIREASCRRGLPGALICEIELRQPQLIWRTSTSMYLVDETGIVYSEVIATLQESDRVSLTVNDTRDQPIALGQIIASPKQIERYLEAVTAFQAAGFQVANSVSIATSIYDFSLTLLGREPGKPFSDTGELTVLMTISYPISEQIKIASEILERQRVTERIDVRVPGFAFAK